MHFYQSQAPAIAVVKIIEYFGWPRTIPRDGLQALVHTTLLYNL